MLLLNSSQHCLSGSQQTPGMSQQTPGMSRQAPGMSSSVTVFPVVADGLVAWGECGFPPIL